MRVSELALTTAVLAVLVVAVSLRTARYPRAVRRWVWVALLEYLGSAVYQFFNGVDADGYRRIGLGLARLMDNSFSWASREVLSLLFQRPSAFDDLVLGPGSNTGSMCAAAALLLFVVRESAYAAQALVTGLAMFGALAVYEACRNARPESSPVRLFFATVLFPSVAFWTAALHKESFCLMGMGFLFSAWQAAYRRRHRALVYAPVGLVIIILFRAPVLPPLALGLALYFVWDRLLRARGPDAGVGRPVYLLIGLGGLLLTMLGVGRVSPEFGLDRIAETVTSQQRAWVIMANTSGIGGSGFDIDTAETLQASGASQLSRLPIALLNALLRPQFFDVTSPVVAASALEMTVITIFVLRAIALNGLVGTVTRIQRSPFLLMCAAITVVGCAFVGLVAFNFGTMARYRVPFLPFYGALLAGLTQRKVVASPKAVRAQPMPRRAVRTRSRMRGPDSDQAPRRSDQVAPVRDPRAHRS